MIITNQTPNEYVLGRGLVLPRTNSEADVGRLTIDNDDYFSWDDVRYFINQLSDNGVITVFDEPVQFPDWTFIGPDANTPPPAPDPKARRVPRFMAR
jgi:hypothetical protein